MVHETAFFYWHGIQSVPLGICPWICTTHYSAPCTCRHLTTQSLFIPPHFHPCINTISPVKKAKTPRSLPLLSLIDYAKQPSHHPPSPPHVFEFLWSWRDASRSSPTLPIPILWNTHLYSSFSLPFFGWLSPSASVYCTNSQSSPNQWDAQVKTFLETTYFWKCIEEVMFFPLVHEGKGQPICHRVEWWQHEKPSLILLHGNRGCRFLSAAWQQWVTIQLLWHAKAPWRLMGSIFHCQLLQLSCRAHSLALCISVSFNWCASQSAPLNPKAVPWQPFRLLYLFPSAALNSSSHNIHYS